MGYSHKAVSLFFINCIDILKKLKNYESDN